MDEWSLFPLCSLLVAKICAETDSDISPEGKEEREYRYKLVDRRDGQGREHWQRMGVCGPGIGTWLAEYKRAVKKGMRPDNVWPSELRRAYNNAAGYLDRRFMCVCPKAFFGGIDHYFPQFCR